MIQRDYFMKMTQMLAAVIAKVLFNKEQKNYEAAGEELEAAAKTIVGIDLNIISLLGVPDVVKLMKTSDLYAGRCLITAEILKEYGDLKDENERINLYRKSLHLYTDAVTTNEIPQAGEYFHKIESLIKLLTPVLSPDDKQVVFFYYEYSKQYSKAEDILFEMIEENVEGMEARGIKFYKNLELVSDDELSAGNLSREEVEESLSEILSLQGKNN